MIELTGNIIEGSYIGAPKRSNGFEDFPTGGLVVVCIDGGQYQRTVYERVVWRNMRPCESVAEFVTVNGINYEIRHR